MKENIEDLTLKFIQMSPARMSNIKTEESYLHSPSHNHRRVNLKPNADLNPMLEYSSIGHDQHKDDDMKKQVKKLMIFKKKASNTSESKFFNPNDAMRIKFLDKLPVPKQVTMVLQLNELITVRKIRNTKKNGIIKRMLHVPSFKLFDVIVQKS